MSDGQSFYLLLVVFYLFDCLKLAPQSSLALRNRLNSKKALTPISPLTEFGGIKKKLYLSSLLPWPLVTFIAAEERLTGIYSNPRNVTRLSQFLIKKTDLLRWLSTNIFICFLVIIPVIYYYQRDSTATYLAIGAGYLLLSITAFVFYKLHKRLLPHKKEERIKGTIFTALLPWHAMRAADEILIQISLPWNKTACLIANIEDKKNLSAVQLLWRKAHFLPQPPYSIAELEPLTQQANIDTSHWTEPPRKGDDAANKYCPCCHMSYDQSASICPECDNISLRSR